MPDTDGIKTLSELRLLRGLTQEQLANQSDIDVSLIKRIEEGSAKPKGSGAGNIAKALGVELFVITTLLDM